MSHSTNLFAEPFKSSDVIPESFVMMNADVPICSFCMTENCSYNEDDFSGYDEYVQFIIQDVYNSEILSRMLSGEISQKRFKQFVLTRMCSVDRSNLRELRPVMGFNVFIYLDKYHGLSLTDTVWFKKFNDDTKWSDVSLYENSFNAELGDYFLLGGNPKDLKFEGLTPEFSTTGCLPKCWKRNKHGTFLLKGGTEGFANAGREPFFEYFAYQVALAMGLSAVSYDLNEYKESVCSMCRMFTSAQIGFQPVYQFMKGSKQVTDELVELYSNLGFLDRFYEKLVFDSVICNVDRHLGNFGFLVDNKSFEIVGVAPLFDHGMSLGWTYVSRIDGGLESYIERANRGSSYIALGTDSFVDIGRKAIKHIDSSKVEALLNFRAESKPGFELHEPCAEFVSRLVQHQAREILR